MKELIPVLFAYPWTSFCFAVFIIICLDKLICLVDKICQLSETSKKYKKELHELGAKHYQLLIELLKLKK